jgi:hypothetical protein
MATTVPAYEYSAQHSKGHCMSRSARELSFYVQMLQDKQSLSGNALSQRQDNALAEAQRTSFMQCRAMASQPLN